MGDVSTVCLFFLDDEKMIRPVWAWTEILIAGFLVYFHRDDDNGEALLQSNHQDGSTISVSNPFLEIPNMSGATEFKKGYVMRKCCYDANGKKSNLNKFVRFRETIEWKNLSLN